MLQHFSENEREYLLYQQRLDAERVEATWKTALDRLQQSIAQERREKEQERQEKEQVRHEKEQERREKERLLSLLQQAGIDPNELKI